MNERQSYAVKNVPSKTASGTGIALRPLEINVIFTDQASTSAALACAQSLARDLGARIHLQFAVAVPFQLPLERPAVSVSFLQEQLNKVLADLVRDGFEATAHLYLCRDRVRALQQALQPNSLVVIGGRKGWWPAPERWIARALRTKGHRVICVDSKTSVDLEQAIVTR